MFEISIEDNFESHEEEYNSFPHIEIWENSEEAVFEVVTDLRKTPHGFWLSCKGVGGILVDCDQKKILAYPSMEVPPAKFNYYLIHAWLPMAYQASGTQVIHASAVVHIRSRRVIVFSGESGSGKSTLAFGLGQREHWRQIADDRLAFENIEGKVKIQPIPDAIKLRQQSAEHFNHAAFSFDELDWFTPDMELDTIFIVEQLPSNQQGEATPFTIQPLTKADAYTYILKNAITLSPGIRELNKDLLQDYLVLANQVKTYTLSYSSTFDILSDLIRRIETDFIK